MLEISNFDTVSPQKIEIKVFAQNPPTASLYTPFKIRTEYLFSTGPSVYAPIDENNNAGSI